jgi:hypothetical protein
VASPEPELAVGADELCRPDPELAEELLPEELLPEELLPADVPAEPDLAADWLVLAAEWCADDACAPGRVYATPVAVSTLARPAAAVTARSRFRCRSLTAARAARSAERGSSVIGCSLLCV